MVNVPSAPITPNSSPARRTTRSSTFSCAFWTKYSQTKQLSNQPLAKADFRRRLRFEWHEQSWCAVSHQSRRWRGERPVVETWCATRRQTHARDGWVATLNVVHQWQTFWTLAVLVVLIQSIAQRKRQQQWERQTDAHQQHQTCRRGAQRVFWLSIPTLTTNIYNESRTNIIKDTTASVTQLTQLIKMANHREKILNANHKRLRRIDYTWIESMQIYHKKIQFYKLFF